MTKKLRPRQAALLKNLAVGMSRKEACEKAGYKPGKQNAYEAVKGAEHRMSIIMDAAGLTRETIVEQYIKPLLEAEETRLFLVEGSVLEHKIPDNVTRRNVAEFALKLHGDVTEQGGGDTTNIQIIMDRPQRPSVTDVRNLQSIPQAE